jgi:hypothetical protein
MQDIIENGSATPAPVQHQIAAAPANAVTPADLLRIAVDKGADLDRLEKLLDLQMKYEANEARKAYVSDMAAFKLNPPEIIKDKQVGYMGKDGFVGYSHASLGNVTNSIIEGLAKHGFSHSWNTEQQGANVVVTCILTHRLGHSERTTLTAPKDDSGKKNQIQQMASAISYLQRYTLLAATGLATQDQDDDGAKAELDTTLADKWIAKANEATMLSVLNATWTEGVDEINKANDMRAYTEFKATVAARKKELAEDAAK